MCNRSRSQESELGPWEGGKPPADAARKLIEEGKIRLRSAVTFERRLGNFMSNRSRKREPSDGLRRGLSERAVRKHGLKNLIRAAKSSSRRAP
jgi:hypothetical protein